MGNHPIIACITVHTVQLLKHEASSFGFIYLFISHYLWSKAKGKSLNHIKTDHLVLSMLKSGLLILVVFTVTPSKIWKPFDTESLESGK